MTDTVKPDMAKPGQRASARKPVTLIDIAAACGVSRATVSLVVRGSPLVNKNTRRRVEEEFKRQGYVYNRGAANLRRQTSSSIALVINDLSNPFFAEFAAGVDEVLADKGYVTLLGSTNESPEKQHAVLSSLIEHNPAGIILSPAEHSDGESLAHLIGPGAAVLVFNRELNDTDWDFLALDNRRGAQMATEHLIAQGHRRIAFYGGHADSSSCQQRRLGFGDAMKKAGIAIDDGCLIETLPNRVEAARSVDKLLAIKPAVTAAVCYNDNVAIGLKLGLVARGVTPGKDFALTGFDDISEAALSTPPLTTLAAAPRARGRQAAELLLHRLDHPGLTAQRVIAPVELIVRASSGTK